MNKRNILRGTITFTTWPGGIFAPASGMSNFTFSFNGGADTFSGTDVVRFSPPEMSGKQTEDIRTIPSGSGRFPDATGTLISSGFDFPPSSTSPPTNTFSGTGQISAPGLSAVPEPTSALLFMGGLGVLLVRRCWKPFALCETVRVQRGARKTQRG